MKPSSLLSLAIAVTFSAMAVFFRSDRYNYDVKSDLKPSINYSFYWGKIDSFENIGLPRTALKWVDEVFDLARKENNPDQILKSMIFKMKFEYSFNPDYYSHRIVQLEEELKKFSYPVIPVIHSMLGEMYWQYFQNNRWRYYDRTKTVNFDQKDINTWDLDKILGTARDHYLKSLDNKSILKNSLLDSIYREVIIKTSDEGMKLPTLYDFLVFRALDFFKSGESSVTRPVKQFRMDDKRLMSPAKQFISAGFDITDSTDHKYQVVRLYQDIIRFHLNDNHVEALVDIDFSRLKYMYDNSVIPLKESVYVDAIEKIREQYKNHREIYQLTGSYLAEAYYQRAESTFDTENNEFIDDYIKAMDLCRDILKDPATSFVKNNCNALISLITQKNLSIQLEKILIPSETFPISITYRNQDSVYIKIYKSSYRQMDTISFRGHRQGMYPRYRNYSEYIVDTFRYLKPYKELTLILPAADDYRSHITEFAMPALPHGNYVLFFSNNSAFTYQKNAVIYDFITVSNLSSINRTDINGDIECYVFDRKTGKTLKNVNAKIFQNEYDYRYHKNKSDLLASYISNEEGYFKIFAGNGSKEIRVDLILNSDTFSTRDFGRSNENDMYLYKFHPSKYHDIITYFFTDRSIYRPGQTFYFKGIVFDTDGKKNHRIRRDYSTSVSFYDANSQLVSSLDLKTNEYGTFSGSFIIPQGKMNGRMSIRDNNGQTYFSVEEYKRPKFEVSFNETQGSYKLGENVTITGLAKAFSGAGIGGAEAKYRIIRKMSWRPFYSYYFPYHDEETEIINGTVVTDEKGEFEIVFNATPDYSVPVKSNPVFEYVITSDVTDLNGETHSSEKTLRIGYKALTVKTNIPELLEKDYKHKYSISTANPEGNFEPAKGTITIHKLVNPRNAYRNRLWTKPDKYIYTEEEFHRILPFDQYKEENNFISWEKELKVKEIGFNTADSKEFDLSDAKKWKSGKYVVEINTKDKFGEPVSEMFYFTLLSKSDQSLPYPTYDFFDLQIKKAEPGENTELIFGTSSGAEIIFELEQDREVLDKKWLKPVNEMQLLQIPIKEEYRGNININYLFIKQGRVYNHSETVYVPYTNKELDISFETFRDKLQPGENEEWRIKVSGKKGDKVASEMVATLYDASLDEFAANNFNFSTQHFWGPSLTWQSSKGFETTGGNMVSNNWNNDYYVNYKGYPVLNWFGFYYYYRPVYSTYDEMIGLKHGSVVVVSSKSANSVNVSGTVKDANGQVLAGASIYVLGTNIGVVTDLDGKFNLKYDAKEADLVITYIGYLKESIKVKGTTVLDVKLTEDIHQLDELVVIGYGTQKRSDVTGAVVAGMNYNAPVFMMAEDQAKMMEEVTSEGEGYLSVKKEKSTTASIITTKQKSTASDLSKVQARTNFNETAFFYPHLRTNENGEVIIKFKIPESLTKWKMLGFAHTQDLSYGAVTNELVTSKSLMVVPNMPRFFREGDNISLLVKISNVSEKKLSGSAQLMLFDALTMKPVDDLLANSNNIRDFSANAGESTTTAWQLSIPEGIQAVTYRVVAKAENFTDGEEMTIPVMSNRILVTETLPVWIRSDETRSFSLDKLVNNSSATLSNHRLTFEFTENPAWYAIQALPYMMEYPWECMEQTFSRFYSNSIATHIVNLAPKIKQVFDTWKRESSIELVSKLEQNQDLKQLLLEETPWVLDAQNETERKNRVALLFDLNLMSNELDRAVEKLKKGQYPSGGWPWFEGGPESWYITEHIVAGFGHLDKLGVKNVRNDREVFNMLTSAIGYIDRQIVNEYREVRRYNTKDEELNKDHLSYTAVHYLYARSFFKDIDLSPDAVEAVHYFIKQAAAYWPRQSKYMQGMIALSLHRDGNDEVPSGIIKSLREFATNSDELGMYWKEGWGWYWYQAPVETQALLIEVFNEVAADTKAVDEMRIWLLRQKQATDWKTTKATSEACYALLLHGTDWLSSGSNTSIKIGNIVIDPQKMPEVKVEAGTGYFKKTWPGNEVSNEMGNVTLTKTGPGVSWGGLYWQYFENLDRITPHETPLKLQKKLFREINSDKGKVLEPVDENMNLKVGDKVIVRIELRVDRAMEYVHMKDMRAACFEPLNVISHYKWQDGLGYYESTKDASVNFFFDQVREGAYVFEYPLRVTHEGDFSNGITTIQSMYAPEFSSHSEGVRVKVGK